MAAQPQLEGGGGVGHPGMGQLQTMENETSGKSSELGMH